MEPERLIIELVRDKLRAACQEYADAKAEQSYVGGVHAVERECKPDRLEERQEEHRRATAALQTAKQAVESWDRALTVALDRLMK